MVSQLNNFLGRWMPFITPLGVLLGVLFSPTIKNFIYFVPYFFAAMTFEGALGMNLSQLKEPLKKPLLLILLLGFLHFLMPLWALALGNTIFHGDFHTIAGIVIGFSIPTGITSFIWISMKNGNKPLALTVIVMDAFLTPIILPWILSLFIGQKVEIDVFQMMTDLINMIVIPTILGLALTCYAKKLTRNVKTILAPFSKLFLGIIVMVNGAIVAPFIKNWDWKLIGIMLTVFFISISGYFFAFLLGRGQKMDVQSIVSFTFLGGMRNISSGAVIAIAYFPKAALIPIVTSMLFQQTLAAIFGSFLDKYRKFSISR